VVGWIERCNFPNSDQQGEWLADDALDDGLREVLGAMGRDAAPVILDTAAVVEAWADGRPQDLAEPPRAAGACETRLRGSAIRRVAQVYTLWMLQRTLDAYRALAEADRKAVDAALAGSGWEAVLAYQPRHRLAKSGFRLVFE
jgi:hypothetical protein